MARKRGVTQRVGSYRQAGKWRVAADVCVRNADTLLDGLGVGESLVFLSKGQVGLGDMVLACLGRAGAPAAVTVVSWGLGPSEIRRLGLLLRDGRVGSFTLLTDASLVSRAPSECALALATFGADSLRLSTTHAKIGIVRGPDGDFAILSSANLGTALRLESFVIIRDVGVAEFLESTLRDLGAAALTADSTITAHRKSFKVWREPGAVKTTTESYLEDGPWGRDVRRAGITYL